MNIFIIILMFGGISFFVFLLFLFILKIEKMIEQKFAAMEMSLEEINKEIFLIKKKLKKADLENLPKVETIEAQIIDLMEKIAQIEEKNIEIATSLQEKINELYLKTKQNKLPDISTDISKSEEEKIIALYNSGYTIEQISRQLRIPAGKIELILKFLDFQT